MLRTPEKLETQKFESAEHLKNTLHQLNYLFFLTGSRFFGNAEENSGWDYFCDYNREIVSVLEACGFKKVQSDIQDVVLFLEHPEFNVNVQMVLCPEDRIRAQEYFLDIKGVFMTLDKQARNELWAKTILFVHSIRPN